MARKTVSALITDLDNTLFDWLASWHHAFSRLLDDLVRVSGIPAEALLPEIKALHQEHGTSEYAFLVHQLPCLRLRARGAEPDLAGEYRSVIEAYGRARQERLALFPGVMDTLLTLKRCGVLLVVYTESLARYSVDRLRFLGLDGVVDMLYAPPDHGSPAGRTAPCEPVANGGLERTSHRVTPRGKTKPNPALLLSILDELGVDKDRAVYVGDSLSRDIGMAQAAGVTDVHASYGMVPGRGEAYKLLRAVSHWSGSEALAEALATPEIIPPSFTLTHELGEILQLFDFVAHRPARPCSAV